jgi:hypothetical protein
MYANKAHLTIEDVRKIILASVFVADEVLLPSSLYVSPNLSDEQQGFVLTRINELHDIGAVRFWEIEGFTNPSLSEARRSGLVMPADEQITRTQYNTVMEMIDERLMEQRQLFLGEAATSYDGITEMVLGRQTMWKFAVAESLKADRLLISPEVEGTMQQYFSDLMRYHQFESQIIERIADRLSLPDVSGLDPREIEICRQFMPAFRTRLLNSTQSQFNELFLTAMVEEIADAIVNEFYDAIMATDVKTMRIFGRPMLKPTRMIEDITWDLLQLLFAPIIAVKFGKLFFEWMRDSSASAPLLLLMRLRQQITQK